jgi:hypothetical protein
LAKLLPLITLAMIFVGNFKANLYWKMNKVVACTLIFSSSAQVINFLVVGSLVIRKLDQFFKSNYNLQRLSILKALLLITLSLGILNTRYALQYLFITQNIKDDTQIYDVSPVAFFSVVVLSDFVPITFLIACIHIGSKGEWDRLLCN